MTIKFNVLSDREADFYGFTVRKNMVYGNIPEMEMYFVSSLERSKNGRAIKCYVYRHNKQERGLWEKGGFFPKKN